MGGAGGGRARSLMESAIVQSFSSPNNSNRLFIQTHLLCFRGDYECTQCDVTGGALLWKPNNMSERFLKGREPDFPVRLIRSAPALIIVPL